MIKDRYLEDNGKTMFHEGNGFMDAIPKYKKIEGAVYTDKDGITNFVSKKNTNYNVNKSYFEKGEYYTEFKDCTEYSEYSEYSEKDGGTITTEYYDTDENLLFIREKGFTFGFCDGSPISGLCIDTAYFPYTDTYYQGDQVSMVKHFKFGHDDYQLKTTEIYEENTKTVMTYDENSLLKTEETFVDDVLSRQKNYRIDFVWPEDSSRFKTNILDNIEYYADGIIDHIDRFKIEKITSELEYRLFETVFYKDGKEEREEYYKAPGYMRVSYSDEYYQYPRKSETVIDYNGEKDVTVTRDCKIKGREIYDIKIETDNIIGESVDSFAKNIISRLIEIKDISPDEKYRPLFNIYVSAESVSECLSFQLKDLAKSDKNRDREM